jgi:2-dehydro-3-deoxyphosphooctonate aldolase (KDO 8-P synthase)
MSVEKTTCCIADTPIGADRLAVIAGPCMAESRQLCLDVAGELKTVCAELGVAPIFKASFDKANRSSGTSFRGPGLEKGLAWLGEVRRNFGLPVLTDIHAPEQAPAVAEAVDCLQIPAFLCRQTDLLVAAARTGRAVNIKKGQFMAPWEMQNAVAKVREENNANVLLTERGTFFGYNRLVNDFRAIPQMRAYAPVAFDATHSVQQPGGLGGASGGEREFAPLLARAAVAAGADALFIETHPEPDKALSDASSQLPLDQLKPLLELCRDIFARVREIQS